MRTTRLVALGLISLLTAPLGAADFPDAKSLPARTELPDPLVTLAGECVAKQEEWFLKRRPQLLDLFQHYMYGRLPAPAKITATVEREDTKYFGGKATKREVAIAVGPSDVPKIHLLLVIPDKRSAPAPVFVGMNFSGNHAIVTDPTVPPPTAWIYPNYPGVKNNRATEGGRGTNVDVWNLEQSIDRGYAVATFYSGDVDPDRKEERGGMQPWLRQRLGRDHGPHDWSTIAAWAWGIHRAVDYLVTDPGIDRKRIAVVGHSRLGKTSLVAAAFDERIALSIPHQAGCGGTAPSRGKVGESVTRINTAFPHWFCDTFKAFNDRPQHLPFDQNGLVALCAPRPVLFSNAVEDQWANPDGQFEVLQAAEPVYRLLGTDGLAGAKKPELNQLVGGRLGYFIRPGKHSMTKDDWKIFLDFADKQLGKPEAK